MEGASGREQVRWRTGLDREGERALAKASAGSAPCQWHGTRVRLSSGALANINLARMRSLQGGPIGIPAKNALSRGHAALAETSGAARKRARAGDAR